MNSILGCEYNSEVTADHGFVYQEELLLHFCLRLMELDAGSFFVGFEVKKFPKLDDIVVQFDICERKYLLLIQAKHVLSQKRQILPDHLYGITMVPPKDIWNNFNLRQYIHSAMTEEVQEKLDGIENYCLRYIIMTNLVYVHEDEVVDERNIDLQDLFESLTDRGAEIHKFGPNCSDKIQAIIDDNLVESKIKVRNLGLDYFQDKLMIACRMPNLEKLCSINDKIMKKNYKVFNHDSFQKIFRKNVIKFTAIDLTTRNRKTLHKSDILSIISETILEVDLPSISEIFIKELPNWIEFTEESLINLNEQMRGHHKILCSGSEKLLIWKVYNALKLTCDHLMVISLSKVSSYHLKALECFKNKLILYVDCDVKVSEQIFQNENIVFISRTWNQSNTLKLISQFLDLTEASKRHFLNTHINLQNHKFSLSTIEISDNEEYYAFMNSILVNQLNGKDVILGTELPKDKIPPVYLDRYPFTEELFLNSETCGKSYLVTGDPGMGKSCGLQTAARYFKSKAPYFWVEVFDLKRYSKVFFSRKKSVFTANEAIDFLLNKMINYGLEPDIGKILLKMYLRSSSPNIFIFFDGFDEISPTYETLVFNLILKLSDIGIRFFVTSRMHCAKVLKGVEYLHQTSVQKYSDIEQMEFMKMYYNHHLKNISWYKKIEKFLEQFFNYFKDIPDFLGTPILLRMLADITVKDCRNYCENSELGILVRFENVDKWSIYKIVFEKSFDVFYEKEGIDQTSNLAIAKREREIDITQKVHRYLAVQELQLQKLFKVEADVSKDAEILGRGFVTRLDDGRYFFVHRTYAEYFCSECILAEIAKYNKEVIAFLSETVVEPVYYEFLFRGLLEKIRVNGCFMEREKLLSCDDYKSSVFKSMRHFCNKFLQHVFINRISEMNIVIKFIENIFTLKEIGEFDFTLFYMKLNMRSIVSDQAIFLVEYPLKIYGSKAKSSIFSQINWNIIEKKFESQDIEFLKVYYEALLERKIVTREEASQEIEMQMKFSPYNGSYKDEMYYMLFDIMDIDYYQEFLKASENCQRYMILDDHFDSYCVLYITLFEKKNDNAYTFIDQLAKFLVDKDLTYRFLERYNLEREVRTELVHVIVDAFRRTGQKFICKKKNSIFYYFWKNQKDHLFRHFLKYLDLEDIDELLQSPNFLGMSYPEYIRCHENGDNLSGNFLYFIFVRFGAEKLYQYLTPSCGADEQPWISVKRDLNLCEQFWKTMKEQEEESEIMVELPMKIIQEKFTYKSEKNKRILFLHTLVSMKYNYHREELHTMLYKWMIGHTKRSNTNSDHANFFVMELYEKNNDGLNPLHLAAMNCNHHFFFYFFKTTQLSDVITLLNVLTPSGRNIFHLFSERDLYRDLWFFPVIGNYIKESKEEVQNLVFRLLLQQDKFGLTPFHGRQTVFYTKFITLLPPAMVDTLFTLQDNNGNSILHSLGMSIKSYEGRIMDVVHFFEKNKNIFNLPELRLHLRKLNIEKLSPVAICKYFQNKEMLNCYLHILNDVCPVCAK